MKSYFLSMAAIGSLFTLVNTAGAQFVLSDVLTNRNLTYDSVAVGDVNGDGKPDLVTVDNLSTFTVATNVGNGIFVSNATYNVGNNTGPSAVAIADINGDGKPDVVTINANNNAVTIFTNAGGGVFVSNASYAVGNLPFCLLVTDVNGDGKPDIITANEVDGTLTILTNAGGTFHMADTVLVANANSDPFSFAVADLTGDGKPDLVAGDSTDGLIEVLTNAGGGIFVSNAVYTSGTPNGNGPVSVVAADFNNDGKMDVACENQDGTVTVFTNGGNGILAQSQSFGVPGINSIPIMAADLDGDGYTDLLVPGQIGNTSFLATLYNRGNGGTFITNYVNSTNIVKTILPGSFYWSVATDINGDGKPDLVGANGILYVYTNGVGSFPNTLSINVYSNINFAPVTNITAEAASPSGAAVNFITTGTNWTGSWPVTNTPPSGSVFPIGVTTVTSSTGYFVKSNIFGSATTNFTVTVVDAPTITLLGANPLTNYVRDYSDPGTMATDPEYGNLTGSIVVSGNLNTNVPGTYTVTYTVTNAAGSSATTNRTVVIIGDTTPPTITLLGANPLTNFVGFYTEPGATATDPVYGNLTSSIMVSGNLMNAPGTYTITYTVTNPAGDSAMTNRTVVLLPVPPLGVAGTTGNEIALFWPPSTDTNYVLQMTTNLSSGDWVDVTNGRRLIGFFVTNTAPAAFFRLQPQ